MKETRFEQLLSLYGADIALWPAQYRAEAGVFVKTAQGKKMLEAEEQLDALFAVNVTCGHEHIEDRNTEAFLARLETVPASHVQSVQQQENRLSGIQGFLASFDVELSSAALASQMAALVVALGMGIMVGFNGGLDLTEAQEFEASEVDISAVWFTDMDDVE